MNTSLEKKNTLALRGLMVFGIMLHHYSLRYTNTFLFIFAISGGCFVAEFFLLSGYGLRKSYSEKGIPTGWFINKIMKLLVPYFLVFIFNYLALAIMHEDISLSDLFMNLITMRVPEQVLWYPKVQLFMYLIFGMVFITSLNSKTKMLLLDTFSIAYITIGIITGIPLYWYMTSIFFAIGVHLAENETIIISFFKRNKWILAAVGLFLWLLITGVVFFFGYLNYEIPVSVIYTIVCVFLFTLFAANTNIKNQFICLIGSCSYELYLVHVVILNLFARTGLTFSSLSVFIAFIVISVITGVISNRICNRVYKAVYRK